MFTLSDTENETETENDNNNFSLFIGLGLDIGLGVAQCEHTIISRENMLRFSESSKDLCMNSAGNETFRVRHLLFDNVFMIYVKTMAGCALTLVRSSMTSGNGFRTSEP